MSRKQVIGALSALVFLVAMPAQAAVVRQPYLQMTTPTSVTVVWRTDTTSDSRVRYGTVQGSLTSTATNASVSASHIVTITGLSPSTKYFYDAGSTALVEAGGTAEHYFVTAPTPGSSPNFRAWVVGDSGNGSSAQIAVRNAMLSYTGAARPDLMLHVGDIAYTSGSDTEFTDFHFSMYQDITRHTVQWPTLGNHEGASTTSGQPGASSGPYYDAFVLPTAGEAGGAASGTEAYYSFNYGNTHFISLNSYQVSRSASGPMATWLQSDLSSTNAQWIVAYWHHPPYSHGTHNSDTDTELREMRANILPILEAAGVDLVLCGHSHTYERSYLIDGTYSTPTPDFATLQATGHVLDDGNGKPSGDGAYQKGSGATSHGGAVYVVAGHGGAATGGSLSHPVMYFSEAVNGSCLLDVSGNTLTLTNVRSSGVVSDTFTIQKGPQTPKVLSANPSKSAVLTALPTIQVTFSTGVTGVDAADLTVNGSPATSLSGPSGGSVYTFSGYTVPANGHVGIVLAAGGIADATNGALQFTGNVWSYTIDTTPPRVFKETPTRNQELGVLPSITVEFTKGVTGVSAGDLRVNGQPATSFSGVSGSSGPYTFTGYPAPPTGLVDVTLDPGGIQDDQLQPFAGDSWSYVLRAHLVINEYLTSNNSSATDEFGEHDDYVEIYNPANVAVDMSGMYLTDTLDFPAQYRIPDGVVIPSHGHLIFWCDSQPQQGTFHTNFNLARAAEAVGLFDTDDNEFAPIDSTSWVNATTDVPVGRFPDGTPGFVNMPASAGATNTIACTTSPQCSALTDQCNTGVCSSNRCVAQFANQGAACDDGIACRQPDTCTNGICDGGPSLCTGGQQCNLVTGLCEVPAADPLPIGVGAPWKYFKGTVAPPASWNQIVFDDSTWTTGASGFGYGVDCVSEHGTVVSDMLNGYSSLYVRRLFRVDNPSAIQSLTLLVDYDDAFVAYVNGHEVARNNVVGTPPSNTQAATAGHECSSCNSAPCNPPGSFVIDLQIADLVSGNNVIAIQGHNDNLGSSDFSLIPTLVATQGQGCAVTPECDDNNACTDDACSGGVCEHTNADANACTDGIGCTNDACSNGTCVSTSACPSGRTCNLGNGLCESAPVTVSFQQGAGSPVYGGAVDTFIQSGSATNNAAAVLLTVDGVPPATDERQILIRFDNIFGGGADQIPVGATITSASLGVNVSNAMLQLTSFNRMLQTWNPASVWATYGASPWNATPGVQADGVEAAAQDDPGSPASVAISPPIQTINVTASLQAWAAAPSSNFGWVLRAAAADSLAIDSSEVTTVANRPKLSVTYTYSPPCGVDADCTDNNVCNGIETCVATVCQSGTPLTCSDGNGCTTDSCNPASGCVFTDNANPCSDGDACTANDACSGGACVPGGAANCNDGNVCTDDSCNTITGCGHVNNAASCSDGNLCTTADVCSGGACGGTPVSCPVGQTCNPGTGTCQSGPVTVTFQQGASGYLGSADTFIDAALGNQATASPIVVDGSPVEQALLRFDGIFGAGAGQIPAGSTITSATLTLWVGTTTNDESTELMSFHRLLHSWVATDVWAAYGVSPWNAQGGIQNDGVDAMAAASAAATMSTLATAYPIDVTTSLQAWSAAPSTNFGWAILPPTAGTNGLRLESAESTTASNARRPHLSVTFTPPATSCTTDPDCNDNNVCNGIETCVANVCQAGTSLVCNDGNVCTTDTCNPASGCVFTNNTVACSDGNACTTGDTCAGGVCVGGAAPNCDDGNVCTTDSCVPASGCAHANNSDSCSDGNLCTTADVCSGGTCGGTPVSCPIGQTCNPGTGTCQSGPQTVTFQQGAAGYLGSADTFIDAALGSQATATPIVIDGSPVEQALLKFDGIFGGGAGQIPAGSTITSATLTLWVGANTSDESTDLMSFHRLLHSWIATDVWSAYGVAPWNAAGGIQNDGVDALAATSATATMSTLATAYPVDVTTSLQAWSASPSSNFGWAILPPAAGTNGLRLESAESTTASNTRRPHLSVTFTPPATGCSTDPDCNDNNACNGIETCVANVCQAGTAPNCDDGNVCTTDSCLAVGGCQHANNTVVCSDGNACTTSDTCAGGVCVGGAAPNCDDGNVCTTDSCVPASGCAHANNTNTCSDGSLCTTGDACSGGVCAGTPVSCPVGQTCNPTNGACETSANPPLPILVGDTWRYFKGTVEPTPPPNPPTWATIGYDDNSWLSGPSGFGYGPDCVTQRGTTLTDMQNPPSTPGYLSLYVRKKFNVSNPAAVTSLSVVLDYDDAAVVYINGTEVARTASLGGSVGTPTAFDTPSTGSHECSVCDGPPCNPGQTFPITLGAGGSPLVSGTNVIAIHAHNQTVGSTDFTLIPTASATVAGCSVDADCNDGVSCTTDTCVSSACVHTSNCLAGQTCNLGTGVCEVLPVTTAFQDGTGGYTGAQDTYLAQAAPTTIEGALDNWRWDTENPAPSQEFGLIRFDAMFGSGPGQIPLGATIQSATLTLQVSNGSVAPNGLINESAVDWSEATETWNTFGGEAGVQADEYLASPQYAAPIATGSVDTTVTTSVQAWASGLRSNFGWVFRPQSNDGVQVNSAEFATVTLRPKLTVVYVFGCSTNPQCDDGNACNGLETCVTGQCQAGTPLNCTDSNPCTSDSCNPGSGCQFVNNTLPCNDGQTCTTGDVCAGGSCVGAPINCNDGVSCTTDTCLEGTGCQYTSNCPGGGSCNLGTGICTEGRMECSPSSIPAGSDSEASLIVILRNLNALPPVRGYQTQVSIARTSGTGTVSVSCPGGVSIDDARSDYLFFNSSNDFPATNCSLKRAASSLLSGGVTVGPTPAYLASYTLTTSPDATAGSTFTISLDAPPASSLVNAAGQAITFDRGPACTLTIASCTTAADCDDGNPCTVDTCDLSLGCQHAPGNAGAICRPAAGACDQAETCTGASAVCPADGQQPNGTSCTDGNACTVSDTCQGGTCVPGTPVVCNDSNPCTDDTCNTLNGQCVYTANDTNSCTDGNVCTSDACSGGACVHSASGVCGIAGTVYYYRDDTGGGGAGSEPSLNPVPSVGIDRTADAAADDTTGLDGTYDFSSVYGNVSVATVAKYGSPRASDHNGAITSFDASVVARTAALLVVMSENQRIAGDVTGDGTISAFDASFVARFAAGLIDHFDVATNTGSDWVFRRCDAYAYPGVPGCGAPSYSFTPVAQNETGKNFFGILYGDVTGNWRPSGGFTAASSEERDAIAVDQTKADTLRREASIPTERDGNAPPADMSLRGWTAPLRAGERREVTIDLQDADGILALDLVLRYDPSRISIVGVRAAGIADGYSVVVGGARGASRVAAYGVAPLSGTGTVLAITIEATADIGTRMPLTVTGAANEGRISLGGRDVLPRPSISD